MLFNFILVAAGIVPWFLLWDSGRLAAKEREAHRVEVRALLQRIGVPVPQQLSTPYKPPAEPKGRWISDPEGLSPIFIPAED